MCSSLCIVVHLLSTSCLSYSISINCSCTCFFMYIAHSQSFHQIFSEFCAVVWEYVLDVLFNYTGHNMRSRLSIVMFCPWYQSYSSFTIILIRPYVNHLCTTSTVLWSMPLDDSMLQTSVAFLSVWPNETSIWVCTLWLKPSHGPRLMFNRIFTPCTRI